MPLNITNKLTNQNLIVTHLIGWSMCVLWHMNSSGLFNAKSCLYIYIYMCVCVCVCVCVSVCVCVCVCVIFKQIIWEILFLNEL